MKMTAHALFNLGKHYLMFWTRVNTSILSKMYHFFMVKSSKGPYSRPPVWAVHLQSLYSTEAN